MLRLSDAAARIIRGLLHSASSAPGSGLRITVDPRYDSLTMALAGAPSPGDAIIGNHESLVFLSADASLRLSGQTLQASDPVERPSFFLS
jgi:hypothetical protein